jgi:hypothetical protein
MFNSPNAPEVVAAGHKSTLEQMTLLVDALVRYAGHEAIAYDVDRFRERERTIWNDTIIASGNFADSLRREQLLLKMREVALETCEAIADVFNRNAPIHMFVQTVTGDWMWLYTPEAREKRTTMYCRNCDTHCDRSQLLVHDAAGLVIHEPCMTIVHRYKMQGWNANIGRYDDTLRAKLIDQAQVTIAPAPNERGYLTNGVYECAGNHKTFVAPHTLENVRLTGGTDKQILCGRCGRKMKQLAEYNQQATK